MMASANDKLLDALTRHQIHLQRLSTATVRKVLALLRRSDTRIVQRLLDEDISALSRTRLERLLNDLRRVIDSAYFDATGALQIDLEALATYESEFQTDLFKRVIPVKLETVTPTAEQVIAAVNSRPFQGKLLREVYKELPASMFRKVRDTIRGGFVEGRTTDQIVRDLRGTRTLGYKDGILAKTRRDVETVVRTAVAHTSTTARGYTYEANEDLVKGEMIVATIDSRTSLLCMGRDGKVYPVGKGPRPPFHFNCRTTTTPILKSWRELGFDVDDLPPSTRATMNGQEPADVTYNDWLKKQDAAFQDDVLGEKRAQLFRAGMSVDRFTDRKGAELNLDQLRRLDAGVFERAGL